ncbi:hypothetical protein A2554_01615 [Candidatus Nomurabacteria bacterium RIFOXYD2_FULL_35_12]|nr:MAG: hypothetical protein A2554_01615 [Candidatus Nomurabacteria bacterium RIFOXYD2_FULL_35_12]
MNQFNRPPQSQQEIKEQKKQEYIALARELSEARERFSFSGVNPESYSELKAVTEEFPEYSAPIDELVERLKVQGMKVVLRKDPKSGNVFVLPLNSEDVEMDNLFPRHLMMAEGMDERLKRLILLNKELKDK